MSGGLGPDMSALTLLSQQSLTAVLATIPGRKQLLLEPGLMRPLDRVANMSVLSRAGVEKVFKFERGAGPVLPAGHTRVYLVSSNLIQAKLVADQVSASLTTSPGTVHIILLPRNLQSIQSLLEEEGLAGFVELHQWCWEFVPLDYDFLSLELPSFLRTHFLSSDWSGLPAVARALWGFKSLYGNIPAVFAQGRSVKKLMKLEALLSEQFGPPRAKGGEVGQLFILERDLDWASCLLSPLTYEGLLDETFGISCGTVEFGQAVTKTEGTTKLQLSSRDKMFDKIRNKHFASIFSVLGVTAKQLSAAQAAASSMNVSQMKQFVATDLKVMKAQSRAVALHIGASEQIQREKGDSFERQLPVEHGLVAGGGAKEAATYIEDWMAQLRPHSTALRLICLLSHCQDGLSLADYQRLKTQFIQAYGFGHLVTWNNLVRLGVLSVKGGLSQSARAGIVSGLIGGARSGTFQQLVKRLNLLPPDSQQPTEPTSPGYVFNGAYSPLCCRLVEEVLRNGPNSPAVLETAKLLPGDRVVVEAAEPGPKVALVLFLGGVTLAEVAAFRWLQTVTGYQFILASTGLASGGRLVADCETL